MNIILEGNSVLREKAKDYISKKCNLKVIEKPAQTDVKYYTDLINELNSQENPNFLLNKFIFSDFVDEITMKGFYNKIKVNEAKAICKLVMESKIPIIYLGSNIPDQFSNKELFTSDIGDSVENDLYRAIIDSFSTFFKANTEKAKKKDVTLYKNLFIGDIKTLNEEDESSLKDFYERLDNVLDKINENIV